jgi:amidase
MNRQKASFELVKMSATQIADMITRRQVSCREVMDAYLDRINQFNPAINAIVSLQPPDRLMAAADEADAELALGRQRGWMHGLPHAVKDFASTRGIRATFGSPIFADFIPQADSIFVERLRANGAQ